ncbi:MAG: hypothetical protein ACYC27_05455 [Armatimonadota bacterium]
MHLTGIGRSGLKLIIFIILTVLLTGIFSSIVLADKTVSRPVIILPGGPEEKGYLAYDASALPEIGYDALRPYKRVAQHNMYYTYRFSPGKGRMAYLLLGIESQFLILISTDEGKSYTPVSTMENNEMSGSRVLIDMTPYLKETDTVLLRFEDRFKEDSWGPILSEILLYNEGPGSTTRKILDSDWIIDRKPYVPGTTVAASGATTFSYEFIAPAEWAAHDTAVYLGEITGKLIRAKLNGKDLDLQRSWDWAWWSQAKELKSKGMNRLEVTIEPENGKAGIVGPARVGLSIPACAAPGSYKLDNRIWERNRRFAPYTPEKMNFLAGNFIQSVYDDRYGLLAFMPRERMPIHFPEESLRALTQLADEDRYTPVVRLEFARRLYHGCKQSILPGGEYIFPVKRDGRPIDIRPLPETPFLTMISKFDATRRLASFGIDLRKEDGSWNSCETFTDTPVIRKGNGSSFTRVWNNESRSVPVLASYPPGDSDIPPSMEIKLDGKNPVRLHVGKLDQQDMWFLPGSYGPESVMLPDGSAVWAHSRVFDAVNPKFRYLMVRGGGSISRSLLLVWNRQPVRVVTQRAKGGRYGQLYSDISLKFDSPVPTTVRVSIYPFDGYPASMKTPRAVAENIVRTGRLGCNGFEPAYGCTSLSLGPNGMAAAAYLFTKYKLPEADEARKLAKACMDAAIDIEMHGNETPRLNHLIAGVEYLHLLGYKEYDVWARKWADRLIRNQSEDGSWLWFDYQWLCMIGMLRAYDITRDAKYMDAYNKALATIEYRDSPLYWKGKPVSDDGFAGATAFAGAGYLGDMKMAQDAIDFNSNFINDAAFGCDLNPYMLGFSARMMNLKKQPKLILDIDEFAEYTGTTVRKLDRPTAYIVNPNHPFAKKISAPSANH